MADKMPSHRAYVVEEKPDQQPFWVPIGSAWMHGDKKGFNLLLSALPIGGKIVLRAIEERPDAAK